jgi:hypothetical protein
MTSKFPGYLLRDRDAICGRDFGEQVRDMGIEEVLSTPRSPSQRAYVERVIGSIRRECFDQATVFDEGSLRRILACYFDYYHRSRTYLPLGKDSPQLRPMQGCEHGKWSVRRDIWWEACTIGTTGRLKQPRSARGSAALHDPLTSVLGILWPSRPISGVPTIRRNIELR